LAFVDAVPLGIVADQQHSLEHRWVVAFGCKSSEFGDMQAVHTHIEVADNYYFEERRSFEAESSPFQDFGADCCYFEESGLVEDCNMDS